VGDIGAILVTPPGMATRDCQRGPHHEQTTIDLIFSTIRAIEGCKIVESLDQGSDHLLIELILLLIDNITRSRKLKPLWKNLDVDTFLSILDKETLGLENRRLRTRNDIDEYTLHLIKGL
jgi:hypothetical protein